MQSLGQVLDHVIVFVDWARSCPTSLALASAVIVVRTLLGESLSTMLSAL